MHQHITIYALTDPRTNAVRYVGKTHQTMNMRLGQHVQLARRKNIPRPVCVWIRELLACNLRPGIKALELLGVGDDWRAAEIKWAARHHGLVNAKKCGGGGTTSYVANWTPELEAQLGKIPDSVIAEQMGITRKAVSYRRNILHIPASFDRTRNTPPPNMAGHNRHDLPAAFVALLGTVPDNQLAMQAGVAKCVIRRERVQRGIASYAASTGRDGRFNAEGLHPRWGTPYKTRR